MSYRIHNYRRFLLTLIILTFSLITLYKQSHKQITATYPASTNNSTTVTVSSIKNNNNKTQNQNEESYMVIELNSKQVLFAQNENVQRAPASTTKLLSGLAAINKLNENEIVRVGEEVNIEGSRLGLRPGDEISVHDLFTAMYLISANDAAAAIAVKANGTISEFAASMNKLAESLGCKNTHFINPHGLPDPDHYTTANDLALIAEAFVKNPKLVVYSRQKTATVTWKDSSGIIHSKDLTNTNELLNVYPGNIGLKTGTTTEAGQCLVSYNEASDGDLLLVLLGSQHRYSDAVQLLDQSWAKLRPEAAMKNIISDPQILLNTPGIWP